MRKAHIALSVLFVFLAMAGSTGAVFEPMHNGEEHCLVCENVSRPAVKTASACSCSIYEELCITQMVIRKDLSNSIAAYANSCLNNSQLSHFRILLI